MSEDFSANLAGFRAGSLLAGYRLEAQVGAGGMAVVFRARDERLGRLVALKILAPALASDSEFRQRFVAESRAAAAVDDPHIIPVYEAGESGGVLFIAMRFVQGGDLRGVLAREGALAPDRAAGFIFPVASALDAAHRAGLVHRDVKPANILVAAREDRRDHVYLSDFGVSKNAMSSVGLTSPGHFLGTPGYAAPEQIRGLAVDGRTDQYALACVTYELLTGAVPFERDQGMAVLLAHLSEPPPSLVSRRPDLSGAADQVLARAMAKAPERRYASCGDFADALREALGQPPAAWSSQVPSLTANAPLATTAAGGGITAAAYQAPPTVTPPLAPEVPPPPRPTESGTGTGSTPALPRQRNRRPIVTAIAVMAVVVLYFAIAAVVHTPPFTKSTHALAGPTQSPTHPSAATQSSSLPPGIAPLTQLLPADIDDPATQCQAHTPPFHVPGLTQSLSCIDPGLPGGNVFAYQANGPADYQTAFLNFNIWSQFYVSSAGSTCPPVGTSQQAQGTVPWHDRYFPSRTGQVLECQWSSGQPTYIWTLPTESAFIVAVGDTTFSALHSWWTKNQQPLNSPSPSAS